MQQMDSSASGMATFAAFKRTLRKMKHPAAISSSSGRIQEIFMSLDLSLSGVIDERQLWCLSLFSARHQLARTRQVRDFLQERFGSLKAAFKAMDEERCGTLSGTEWTKKMIHEHGFGSPEDLQACFRFIDKDGGRQFTSRE